MDINGGTCLRPVHSYMTGGAFLSLPLFLFITNISIFHCILPVRVAADVYLTLVQLLGPLHPGKI